VSCAEPILKHSDGFVHLDVMFVMFPPAYCAGLPKIPEISMIARECSNLRVFKLAGFGIGSPC